MASRLKTLIKSLLPEEIKDKLVFLKCGYGVSPYHGYNDLHRAIFIHIPKAAGTSVYTSLFGQVKRNHIRLIYFEAYDKNKFDKYFKFAFARNPYDRLVSSFFYIKNKNDLYTPIIEKYSTFDEFVDALNDSNERKRIFGIPHFATQHHYLKDRFGKVGVDFLGKFENLESDFLKVKTKLKIEAELDHRNRSKHKPYMEYYTSRSLFVVNRIYQNDFSNLGYNIIKP